MTILPRHAIGRIVILGLDGGVLDERPAPALLQIVQRVNLAGHFELTAIDRVVPSLDVDRAREAAHAEDRDDVRPVRIAKARSPVPHELLAPAEALLLEHIAGDRRVLAVDVIDAAHPLAELTQRGDPGGHLMGKLPLQRARLPLLLSLS